jgi:SAM-dependent methyltransferase
MSVTARLEEFFFEIHQGLPRQGPGDSQSTRRAFCMLPGVPSQPRILDVGCGPGMQTRDLVRLSKGIVCAVDTHLLFLQELRQQLRHESAASRRMKAADARVHCIRASMLALPFDARSFDLIWSECAIYIMGFDQGLKAWKPLIKPDGYLVVSEISWLRPDAPAELKTFWASSYPGIRTIEANLQAVKAAGYRVIGHFVLPAASWWPDYYSPLQERIKLLRDKYRAVREVQHLLDEEQEEIELFRRYSEYYGYVFYLAHLPRPE